MFFSSVHCYDTQNRQEIRGLSINTVALLSLKMGKKKNPMLGVVGRRSGEAGGQARR